MAAKIRPQPIPKDLPTHSTVLSTGRAVTMREAIAQDILVLQNLHGGKNEVEQGMFMMARLATGKDPIQLEEIQVLSLKDFQKLSELVAKCTGMGEDEDEEEDEQDPFS